MAMLLPTVLAAPVNGMIGELLGLLGTMPLDAAVPIGTAGEGAEMGLLGRTAAEAPETGAEMGELGTIADDPAGATGTAGAAGADPAGAAGAAGADPAGDNGAAGDAGEEAVGATVTVETTVTGPGQVGQVGQAEPAGAAGPTGADPTGAGDGMMGDYGLIRPFPFVIDRDTHFGGRGRGGRSWGGWRRTGWDRACWGSRWDRRGYDWRLAFMLDMSTFLFRLKYSLLEWWQRSRQREWVSTKLEPLRCRSWLGSSRLQGRSW